MSGLVVGADGLPRCAWAAEPELYRDYHDHEWGRPVMGEAAHLERLTLEAFQSGLSWLTILRKRPGFRAGFANFDPDTIATYDAVDVERLMADPEIVRNRRKIEATLTNARATVQLRAEGGLAAFIEGFRPDQRPAPSSLDSVPGSSAESLALSKALKKKGFVFVGPTTMYALMQALGLVNDHVAGCHARATDIA